mgnify:CR=1 FL=1
MFSTPCRELYTPSRRAWFFEFGSIEDHYKYREDVKKSYPYAHYPVFEGYNHMQYQIKDTKGFAEMLVSVIDKNEIPRFSFLK